MRQSIFADDWRDCLIEHYKHVKRTQDVVTERTLLPVLHRLGFTEADLQQAAVEATMRADEMPADYVPDLPQAAPANDSAPHPAECTCSSCQMDALIEQGHDAEGQPLSDDQKAEQAERDAAESKPRQLSMF